MLSIKSGASVMRLTPPMALGAVIVSGVFAELGYACVLTSGDDSKHGGGPTRPSLHTDGNACDFRTWHVATDGKKLEIRDACQAALGQDFDVVFEPRLMNGDKLIREEHLHVEFDPKRGADAATRQA